jgi:hypothetical protein
MEKVHQFPINVGGSPTFLRLDTVLGGRWDGAHPRVFTQPSNNWLITNVGVRALIDAATPRGV